MKKAIKGLVGLFVAAVILTAVGGTDAAAYGSTVILKSHEGLLDNLLSLSNVIGTANTEYIKGENLPTYLCTEPTVVTALANVNTLLVQKVTDENLEKAKKGEAFLMNPVLAEGQATIWDAKAGREITVDCNDLDEYEIEGPPEIHAGTSVTITEKGVYVIHCVADSATDYINAIVIVDGGNAPVQAAPTVAKVQADGQAVELGGYNINGNNYFKLRDVAYMLNGSGKQFEVQWNEEEATIVLTSGTAYTPQGGEMQGKAAEEVITEAATAKVSLDGQAAAMKAYKIAGNHYFKLRDIGRVFDFYVHWDEESSTIFIDTAKAYVQEG